MIKSWKNQGLMVVFTNGCFDILHRGHIDYLSKAARLGDRLIIGLNSDKSVRKLKGPGRPIQSEDDRKMLLMALKVVDAVIIFSEDTPRRLISELLPDVLVKGGDYTIDTVVGSNEVLDSGGRVEIIPLTKGKGTTELIKKITSSRIMKKS